MENLGVIKYDGTSDQIWKIYADLIDEKQWNFTKIAGYNCPGIDAEIRSALEILAENTAKNVHYVVFADDDAVAQIRFAYGFVNIDVTGINNEAVDRVMNIAKGLAPEEETPEDASIYVTFWAHGAHGPVSQRRKLDVPPWNDIQINYHTPTREHIAPLMNGEFRPKKSGQLLLWHGEPGTGKTTALRAMGWAWRNWCEVHYITDPEKFFGDHADYMMKVMTDSTAKWRLLVMEDTGEFLTVDARTRVASQGLSRFLNAMDGLLGQGLDFTCLVTTNEELKRLHPAVTRPGRCLAVTEFKPLTGEEVVAWAKHHNADLEQLQGATPVAELFSLLEQDENSYLPAQNGSRNIGFSV
jgi:hypothetical protein